MKKEYNAYFNKDSKDKAERYLWKARLWRGFKQGFVDYNSDTCMYRVIIEIER